MIRVEPRLVSDGNTVRATLEQVRADWEQCARIDWLRATVPTSGVATAVQDSDLAQFAAEGLSHKGLEVVRLCNGLGLDQRGALWFAREAAKKVAALLGCVEVAEVEDRGMDYYTARAALVRDGAVVGMVLAGGKQPSQAATVHINLFGAACLWVQPDRWACLREWIEQGRGWITRADIAVDVFEGDDISALVERYAAGEFDVRGKRPHEALHGAWCSGHSRTFQVGKRETGKTFRAYEKGDELFGPDANDPWVRYEVEFRRQGRIVDLDVLVRPGDFFAGAYDFCEALIRRVAGDAQAQAIPTGQRSQAKTAEAAVSKLLRFFRVVVAPTCRAVFESAETVFDTVVLNEARCPGALKGVSKESLKQAFEKVGAALIPSAPQFHPMGT